MKREIVGFVGCYSHDVILMLAKVAVAMERRVLLLDHNEKHILRVSVPVPAGVSVRENLVEYDGLFFSEQKLNAELLAAYDLILIDFGMQERKEKLADCTQLFLVTDMLPHHILQLRRLPIREEAVRRILVRDAVGHLKSGAPELWNFLQTFPNRRECVLLPDRRDIKNRYVCETVHEYQVKAASPELREFIYDTVREWCTELSEKEFWKRVRRQERRGYA